MSMIPWSSPDIGQEEKEAAKRVIDSGWMTQGEETERFESEIKKYIGCREAVVVNNGTSGLIAALLANGIGPGDEVIVPTYTFAASANAVLSIGARPVLADSDPRTFNTNPEFMRGLVTARTKAIMPVDIAGMPVDLDAFADFAAAHKLIIIEDAAEAVGAQYKGRKIGSFDHTSVFSFHMAKIITTVEGGCITTNDPEVGKRLYHLRNHGMKERYKHTSFGLNMRITDIQAAIGRVQLKNIEKHIHHRNKLVALYKEELGLAGGYGFQEVPEYVTRHPYMFLGIQIDADKRDFLIDMLNSKQIDTRSLWLPLHQQEYHKKFLKGKFPHAEMMARKMLSLPMGNKISEQDVKEVVSALKKCESEKATGVH